LGVVLIRALGVVLGVVLVRVLQNVLVLASLVPVLQNALVLVLGVVVPQVTHRRSPVAGRRSPAFAGQRPTAQAEVPLPLANCADLGVVVALMRALPHSFPPYFQDRRSAGGDRLEILVIGPSAGGGAGFKNLEPVSSLEPGGHSRGLEPAEADFKEIGAMSGPSSEEAVAYSRRSNAKPADLVEL
jgi:hypothetical protein